MSKADMDATLWAGIEGALGKEASDRLLHNDLSTIVAHKIASEGAYVSEHVTLADVAPAVAKRAYRIRKEAAALRDGVQSLNALIPAQKTASPTGATRPVGLFPRIAHAYRLKTARAYAPEGLRTEIDAEFDELAVDIYDTLTKVGSSALASSGLKKTREMLTAAASKAKEMAPEGLSSAAAKAKEMAPEGLGKGLAIGAGITAPAVVGANYVADRATDNAQRKALETAAGVAGIGLGTYGLGTMLSRGGKQASAQRERDLIATVYLDEMLSEYTQTEKVADLRRVNREYGVTLLFDTIQD